MTQAVALIDLTPYYERERDPAGFERLLRQVDAALGDIGFLCVTGTRLDPAQVSQAQQLAMRFFDAPQVSKDQVRAIRHSTRGYTGLGDLGLSYAMDADDIRSDKKVAPPDLFERYRIGPVDEFAPALQHTYANTAYAPNIWPADLPEFAPVMQDCYRQMNLFSRDLLKVFALVLGLPETWFEDKVDHSMASLAINHYPAQLTAPLPGQLRAGPHTDYGTLTVVAPTSAPGGLQIRTRNGEWEDVSVAAGTYVVNIGDMMAQWTNDRWVSTVHRVVNPQSGAGAGGRRLSLVFFHQPNPDALIDCIPTCITAEQPKKYAAVNAGQYISEKINRHFKSYLAA
jgi:isopenicillin N synthase-like dioxygenase